MVGVSLLIGFLGRSESGVSRTHVVRVMHAGMGSKTYSRYPSNPVSTTTELQSRQNTTQNTTGVVTDYDPWNLRYREIGIAKHDMGLLDIP